MTSGDFTITVARASVREEQTAEQLRRILDSVDVSRWVRTYVIRIEEGAIPFSHPVLRLNTRHLDNDDRLLSTFLHEQIHWILAERRGAMAKAARELRRLYALPVGHPAGAADAGSSYLHLVVNYLELVALEETVGEERARAVFEHWLNDHYTELYRIVLDDRATIAELVSRYRCVKRKGRPAGRPPHG